MPEASSASNTTAPTRFVQVGPVTYAYRRFGSGSRPPLLCLQHFTGTLDNWDPAVTDPLAREREVILFENAGIGRSTGVVPETISGMSQHVKGFLSSLRLDSCDVLGFSLGGMIAQQLAKDQPSLFRRMILVGTAPRGGEDIMHLNKPSLAPIFANPALQGYARLQKLFFAPSESSQAAGAAFVGRLELRTQDREPAAGPNVAKAQLAAFRDWERADGERFADLLKLRRPTLVVNGVHDELIPVKNSYWLSAGLPNAVLMTYPDSGHGSLFQFHESFTRQTSAFLASDTTSAAF